ncbi:MAG: hypothetical protein QGI26_04055 [Myxococcota bacterium]|nr:hypothetical protein [Myxococcota bacterium]MDP7074584.1 hypothetical protein [Myxococcota bacterium]MDP7299444.1 hypothetical protein [Myxococcota bacterium]
MRGATNLGVSKETDDAPALRNLSERYGELTAFDGFSPIEDRDTGLLSLFLVAPVSPGGTGLSWWHRSLARAACWAGSWRGSPSCWRRSPRGVSAFFAALGIGLATQLHWLESFRTFAAPIAIPLCLLSGILFSLAELPFFCAWRHLRIE